MDNSEIMALLNQKKSKKTKKAVEKIELKDDLSDRPMTSAGKPSAFTYEELGDKPLSSKGHIGYFKGKPIDKMKFVKAVRTFLYTSSMHKTYKMSGLSEPTYVKRVKALVADGELPGHLFTDGQPLYLADIQPSTELEAIQVQLRRKEMWDRRHGNGRKHT